MHREWSLVCLCAALAAPAEGASIYKCQDERGHLFYRDHPCDHPDEGREIDDSTYTVTGRGGLTDREWDDYRRLRDEQAAAVQARSESGRTEVSYEDRLRLRELRMRREDIKDSLKRGTVSVGRGVVLRQELEEIGRQEDEILNRGHRRR